MAKPNVSKIDLLTQEGDLVGSFTPSEIMQKYPSQVVIRNGVATLKKEAASAVPAPGPAPQAKASPAGKASQTAPQPPVPGPQPAPQPKPAKPKRPSGPTPRKRLAKLGASSREINYLARSFEGKATSWDGKPHQKPADVFRSVLYKVYPDGKIPGANRVEVEDIVDVVLDADRHSAEGHEAAVEHAYKVILRAYRQTQVKLDRAEAQKLADLHAMVASGDHWRALAREAAERKDEDRTPVAREKGQKPSDSHAVATGGDEQRAKARKAAKRREKDLRIAAHEAEYRKKREPVQKVSQGARNARRKKRRKKRPHDDRHSYEVRTPSGAFIGHYTQGEYEFLFHGEGHFKGEGEKKYWEVPFEAVEPIMQSSSCRWVQAKDGTFAIWCDELLNSWRQDTGECPMNNPKASAPAATPRQKRNTASLAPRPAQRPRAKPEQEGPGTSSAPSGAREMEQKKLAAPPSSNTEREPAKTPAAEESRPPKRKIRGGDVLQSSTAFSRHYVFDLGGTLYVDRTPKDLDGEYLYPYGTSLIELAACPLEQWRVIDHYGTGTVPEGRQWRERYLEERRPTPEKLADAQWRRDYGYNG